MILNVSYYEGCGCRYLMKKVSLCNIEKMFNNGDDCRECRRRADRRDRWDRYIDDWLRERRLRRESRRDRDRDQILCVREEIPLNNNMIPNCGCNINFSGCSMNCQQRCDSGRCGCQIGCGDQIRRCENEIPQTLVSGNCCCQMNRCECVQHNRCGCECQAESDFDWDQDPINPDDVNLLCSPTQIYNIYLMNVSGVTVRAALEIWRNDCTNLLSNRFRIIENLPPNQMALMNVPSETGLTHVNGCNNGINHYTLQFTVYYPDGPVRRTFTLRRPRGSLCQHNVYLFFAVRPKPITIVYAYNTGGPPGCADVRQLLNPDCLSRFPV